MLEYCEEKNPPGPGTEQSSETWHNEAFKGRTEGCVQRFACVLASALFSRADWLPAKGGRYKCAQITFFVPFVPLHLRGKKLSDDSLDILSYEFNRSMNFRAPYLFTCRYNLRVT